MFNGPSDARVIEADALLQGGGGVRADPSLATARYEELARAGSGEAACRCALLAAYGLQRPQNWEEALDFLLRGAELDEAFAQGQLRVLAGATGENWRAMRSSIELGPLLTARKLERLSSLAVVGACRQFAPPAFAPWLIARARGRMEASYVTDLATGRSIQDETRTALFSPFHFLECDVVLAVLQQRAARLTSVGVEAHEPPNLISYDPGQKFDLHYDFIPTDGAQFEEELRVRGQRLWTFVTYLNDDFEGAPTHFPKLDVSFRGEVGDAIVFCNVRRDGAPDPMTLHAGMPPTAGRKWVLSQWLRDRPQRLTRRNAGSAPSCE